MLIICTEKNESSQHGFESQSHRTSCWKSGYIPVPSALEATVVSCSGYCDLVIENGALVSVIPRPELIPAAPPPEPTTEDIMLDLLSDHEYRLCMSELTGGETV